MNTPFVLLTLLVEMCSSLARAADTPHVDPAWVYVNSFVFVAPGHIERVPHLRGFDAVYVLYPDGRLDVVECGLEFNFDKRQLRALLDRAVVGHGSWRPAEPGAIRGYVPCSRLPQPPGAKPCSGPQPFWWHRFKNSFIGTRDRNGFGPTVNPNWSIVQAPDLRNLHSLEQLLGRPH